MGVLSLRPLGAVYKGEYIGKKFRFLIDMQQGLTKVYTIIQILIYSKHKYNMIYCACLEDPNEYKYSVNQFLKDVEDGLIVWES